MLSYPSWELPLEVVEVRLVLADGMHRPVSTRRGQYSRDLEAGNRARYDPGAAPRPVRRRTSPVGLQIVGYGFATSYQYPSGLNLTCISEPPLI